MMGINIIDANICHNFLHLFKIQIRTVSQETLHHFLAWKSSYFRVEMSKELMTVFLNQTHLVEKHTWHIFSGVSLTISFDIFKSPRAPFSGHQGQGRSFSTSSSAVLNTPVSMENRFHVCLGTYSSVWHLRSSPLTEGPLFTLSPSSRETVARLSDDPL